MNKPDVQVNVRLPADLLETLKAAAAASGRSLTAEIGKRLSDSFPPTLEDVKLQTVLNSLYVTQALEYRLELEFEASAPGSARREKIKAQLASVRREIEQIKEQRNHLIEAQQQLAHE